MAYVKVAEELLKWNTLAFIQKYKGLSELASEAHDRAPSVGVLNEPVSLIEGSLEECLAPGYQEDGNIKHFGGEINLGNVSLIQVSLGTREWMNLNNIVFRSKTTVVWTMKICNNSL